MSESLSVQLPDDFLERIAQRAAEIVLEKIISRDNVEWPRPRQSSALARNASTTCAPRGA